MRTLVKALAWALVIAFCIWVILSWLEVVNNNMAPGYIYSQFNFFAMLF